MNGFDWINGNIPGTSNYNLTSMWYNPGQPLTWMSNIQNANIATDYSYLNAALGAELMTNNVGWELLLVNLGRYPDDISQNPDLTLSGVPYLVFYNRYSGIVRVFVQYGYNEPPGGTVQGVKINLSYELFINANNLSGILRLGEGIDRALDRPTAVQELTAIAPRNGQNNFWMSADFQTTYDPCVCTYPTNLKLDFNFYSTTQLKLYGRGITTNEDLVANSSSVLNNDFLSNLDPNTNDNQGFIMYKRMEELMDDYISRMEEYKNTLLDIGEQNKKIEQNLAIIKASKIVVTLGIGVAVGHVDVAALQTFAADLFFQDTSTVSKEKAKKLLSKAEKIIGEELKMYINKNFITQAKPNAPAKPTASFTEMNFVGILSDSTSINGPLFSTPGSFHNKPTTSDLPIGGAPTGYPVFNQPLGTFSLLATPKVIFSERIEDQFEYKENFFEANQSQAGLFNIIGAPYVDWLPQFQLNSGVYQNWTKSYQMKLLGELKYAFNTSLDIKGKPVVKAAFVIKAKPERIDNEPINGSGSRQNTFLDPTYTTNVESINLDVDDYTTIYGQSGHDFEEGTNPYLKMNPKAVFSHPNYYWHTSALKKDSLLFSTPFLPIDNFLPAVFAFGLKNERIKVKTLNVRPEQIDFPPVFLENEVLMVDFPPVNTFGFHEEQYIDPKYYGYKLTDFDIELKISVEMEFNTLRPDGTPNQVSQVYTYKVPKDASHIAWDIVNPLYPNLEGSSGDITQYPENLSFTSDVDFNGSPVVGCKYNNNHYTCKAWNSIIIDANMKSTNGKTADFIAGEIIEVFPEAIISPEVDLYIEKVLDHTQPMPPANDSYVTEFCLKSLGSNEPSYQANIPSKELLDQIALAESQREKVVISNDELDVSVFPNPASNHVIIRLSREAFQADLKVIDLMGRNTNCEVEHNGLDFIVNLDNLNSGSYLVKITSVEGTITKNLIVK